MMLWTNALCERCGIKNWVYLGDPEDLSRSDVDACECFDCHHIFWLGEPLDEEDDRDLDEAYVEEGLESPE